jgi:hypothetical protein
MKTPIKVHINFQNGNTLTNINNETMNIYIQKNDGSMEKIRHSKNPIKSKTILNLLLPYSSFTRLHIDYNECKTENPIVNEKIYLGDKFLTRSWDTNDYKYKEILHGSFYPISISTYIYDRPYKLVLDEDNKYITII